MKLMVESLIHSKLSTFSIIPEDIKFVKNCSIVAYT